MRDQRQTIYIDFYDFKNECNVKRLLDNDKYSLRRIQEMEKAIEDVKEYRKALYEHMQQLQTMEYKLILRIKREKNYSSGKIHYYVSIKKVFNENMKVDILSETYHGTERKKALNRFKELKKLYPGIENIQELEKGRWEK